MTVGTESSVMIHRDPSQNVLGRDSHPLETIFKPRTVAVVGATDKAGSVGRTIFWNLISNPFGGTIYPIHPKKSNILGIKAYPSMKDVSQKIDLAVVVTPAQSVPAIVKECVEEKVPTVIVISAGFKEIGEKGLKLENEISEYLKMGKTRLIGPNCLGVMNPITGLNATFARVMAKPGHVAFVSQSGALCTAILDWSLKENFGFSAFMSIGSMLDIGWGDIIDYLGNDPDTHSIILYMESIGNARAFLSIAREVALNKPIIVLKAGHTEAASKAAASHTGALTGSDEVLDAAFKRCGVLRVNSIADLFYVSEVLAKQPRPKGKRLTVITNAGGAGVLATDHLVTGGGKLAELSEDTLQKLNIFLPPPWSHHNPIDILGDADPQRYRKTLEIATQDPNSDGFLIILTPQAMTDPTQTAQEIKSYVNTLSSPPQRKGYGWKTPAGCRGKPILASWMGGSDVEEGHKILNQAGLPTFSYPDTAARIFNYMWKNDENLKSLYETPASTAHFNQDESRSKVREMIQQALRDKRTLLTEFESKQVLAGYHIPTVRTEICHSEDEAEWVANNIGYPVVLKLHSESITHKTDVGGVQLNLKSAPEVRNAFRQIKANVSNKAGESHFQGVTAQPMIRLEGYELILGSHVDAQLGPTLLFGSGGQLVEVMKDYCLGLPPLNTTLARRIMENTHIYKALMGVRGRQAVDLEKLEELLVQFSELIINEPWIKEIDINPLWVSENQITALDARVVLHEPHLKGEDLPKPAIRPYPAEWIREVKLKDGTMIMIRPIRPEDEPLLVELHRSLSERSVMLRFLQPLTLDQRIAHERLIRRCFIDYDRQMALVAIRKNRDQNREEMVAIGRLSRLFPYHADEAEFAILVSDPFQRHGLGTEILKLLVQIGEKQKLRRISAEMLSDNLEMQNICKKLGFTLSQEADEKVISAAFTF